MNGASIQSGSAASLAPRLARGAQWSALMGAAVLVIRTGVLNRPPDDVAGKPVDVASGSQGGGARAAVALTLAQASDISDVRRPPGE